MNRREQIIEIAEDLLDRHGPEGVSMRAIAEQVGIKAPSLYKHFADKTAIEAALQERALRSLAASLPPTGGLAALGAAYRRWALAHPHGYALSSGGSLHRDRLPTGLEDAAAAPLLAAVGGDINLARAVWGMAHGLVELELAGRFPPDTDLDAAWTAGINAFTAPRPSEPGPPP